MPPPSTPRLTGAKKGRGSVTAMAGWPDTRGTGSPNWVARWPAQAPAQLISWGARRRTGKGGRHQPGVGLAVFRAERAPHCHLAQPGPTAAHFGAAQHLQAQVKGGALLAVALQ